ncbi:DsbA family protein [Rhodococcus sp. UNC363MFTsu5.1]|uniref:DsbA family protein n=1 Tax=Rhodococcus sp. UNC363MFTsu5.1 TaxID=1449069 RepID=UPI00068E9F2F|nr:thioredoxin domain-containing protein [Rhodococcus sp. UNC363MFTsu5.1]
MKSRPTSSPARKIAAGLAVLAAVALLVLAISQFDSDTSAGSEQAKAAATQSGDNAMYRQLAALARRDAADPLARGSATAPVVMIEYSDFQCPFCRQFAQNTEPTLVEKYVDSGQLRIEWRNLALFGDESELAARAGWAAGQQGKFPELHSIMFEHSPAKKNTGVYTADRLTEWAAQAGVADLTRFRADMDSDAAHAAVKADVDEAIGIGINSTPAFLINGRPVLGARPIEQMIAVIEAGLQDGTEAGR